MARLKEIGAKFGDQPSPSETRWANASPFLFDNFLYILKCGELNDEPYADKAPPALGTVSPAWGFPGMVQLKNTEEVPMRGEDVIFQKCMCFALSAQSVSVCSSIFTSQFLTATLAQKCQNPWKNPTKQ